MNYTLIIKVLIKILKNLICLNLIMELSNSQILEQFTKTGWTVEELKRLNFIILRRLLTEEHQIIPTKVDVIFSSYPNYKIGQVVYPGNIPNEAYLYIESILMKGYRLFIVEELNGTILYTTRMKPFPEVRIDALEEFGYFMKGIESQHR